MAAAQPARFGASGDDIADWMAQRWRDVVNLGPEAEDAGRRLWAQATRTGQDLSAPNLSDVYALGAQYLSGGAASADSAPLQQGAPSQSATPNADDNSTDHGDWSDYPWPGNYAASGPAFGQRGLLQLAAAPAGLGDYLTAKGCVSCHGRYGPGTTPPVWGQNPLPPTVLPRQSSSGGGGSQPKDDYPQCEQQERNDRGICAQQPTAQAQAVCMESAVRRRIYCDSNHGEIGSPDLFTAYRKSGRRWP
jgi:hypothetical protein